MSKHASQLAIISLCLGACSQPQPSSTAQGAARSAAGAASPTTTPGQSSGVETDSAPHPGAGNNNATPAAGSSGGAAAAGSGGSTARGDAAAAAGSGTPDGGTRSEGTPDGGTRSEGTPSAAAAGCNGDPLALLRGYAPADEDLAGDYEKYLTEELGPLSCATEGTGSARTLTQTIFVPPDAIYDGKGEKLSADAAAMRCDTSEGEQGESQRPFFLLAPGAQLKNVTITYPGCEGVHMMGDNALDYIVWEDAGEDAASVRSYFPGGKITISNSEGHKAADKMFQFNAPCDVRIESFQGSDMGKLVRQNGGSEFELHIDLNQVTVTDVISAVVQSDSPRCFVRYHALSYMFKGSGDKSDRVFRDLPPANVSEY